MPVTKNATIRYKFLDELLSDRHHHYTMADLTDKVNEKLYDLGYGEVTKRCIEKDIVFLKERPFSAPIQKFTSGDKDCYRYSKSGYSIFQHELSREEMSILYEVLNTVGQFKGLPNFAWLNGLRANFGMKKHRQVLSFAHNPLLKNSNLLASLYEVIAYEQVIELTYKRFSETNSEIYNLHPYLLKQYSNRWFMVGMREDTKQIYTIPVDRIIDFRPLPDVKFNNYDGDIERYFDNVIGITVYEDVTPMDIYLWVADSEYPYLETKPLHHSQITLSTDEAKPFLEKYDMPEGKIVNIKCCQNYELEQHLICSFQKLIVLEPANLRDSITEKVNAMYQNYAKLNDHLANKEGFEPVK